MLDPALHAYLRALVGRRAVRVGPFLVSLDDHDAGLFRNYAIPDDAAKPTPDQVAALVAVFTDHGRTPRLEYLPALCPTVEPGLLAAGFVPERRLPVMTCAPADVIAPRPPRHWAQACPQRCRAAPGRRSAERGLRPGRDHRP